MDCTNSEKTLELLRPGNRESGSIISGSGPWGTDELQIAGDEKRGGGVKLFIWSRSKPSSGINANSIGITEATRQGTGIRKTGGKGISTWVVALSAQVVPQDCVGTEGGEITRRGEMNLDLLEKREAHRSTRHPN